MKPNLKEASTLRGVADAPASPFDADGLFVDDPGAMTLASGRKVNPLTITRDDVVITDIARSLSRQCRYNGHVGGFLSVARHSLWVCEHLRAEGRDDLALCGLLHDAAEAYLGDMIRPLKMGELGSGYLAVEEKVEAVIADRFGLPFPWPSEVRDADNYVLINIELDYARWEWNTTPADDEALFLAKFDRLWQAS